MSQSENPVNRKADFYVPSTEEDRKRLRDNRATLWPKMLFCIALVLAIIFACAWVFGWMPTLVGLAALGVAGICLLVSYGSMHAMTKEEERAAIENLPGCDIFEPEDVRITGGKSYDSIARLPIYFRISSSLISLNRGITASIGLSAFSASTL